MTIQHSLTTQIQTAYDAECEYWTATVSEFDGMVYVAVFEDAEGDTEAEAIADAQKFIALMNAA